MSVGGRHEVLPLATITRPVIFRTKAEMPDSHLVQTARLNLRPLREADLPLLYAIQGNRDAMRFTCFASTLEEFSRRLRAFEDSRARLGFAPWVVVDRSESRLIGWGGLNVDPLDPGWGNEVSYWFDPAYWGRGLATELVWRSLSHAFDTLSLSRVSAFAMPDNIASIRVLEKCGFAFLRYEPSLGRNRYEILSPSQSAA